MQLGGGVAGERVFESNGSSFCCLVAARTLCGTVIRRVTIYDPVLVVSEPARLNLVLVQRAGSFSVGLRWTLVFGLVTTRVLLVSRCARMFVPIAMQSIWRGVYHCRNVSHRFDHGLFWPGMSLLHHVSFCGRAGGSLKDDFPE